MKRDTPHILLVNPWIHDFAAYDFWAKPIGLLTLASILNRHGFRVSYIDCLDRFHPRANQTDPYARNGRGPYLKTPLPKPKGLEDVTRTFSRYGIRPEWFREDLLSRPVPDLILITSLMTYWYPGIQESIAVLRETFPNTPIALGGIYASLCREHAESHSGADAVFTGPGEENILRIVSDYTRFSASPKFDPGNLDSYPYPAFELQRKIAYVPLLTSRGCPFSCAYCASPYLNLIRMRRHPDSVVEEIGYWWAKYTIKDFAFYDDALLADAELHAIPLLEGIIRAGFRVCFHTPNAVHIRSVSKRIARLMYRAGFKTLRLGLETTVFENRTQLDRKVTEEEFIRALECLKEAGFNKNQIGAYLLVGLPGQSNRTIENSINTVRKNGITPVLAHYSPIPHTPLWKAAVDSSRYDLESDPIFTNNAIFPCQSERFSWQVVSRLKNLAAT